MLLGINWLDIVFFAILVGTIFKGAHSGIGSQIVSLVWVICLVFLSIGYYYFIARNVFGFIDPSWGRALSFFLIVIAIFAIIRLLENIFNIEQSEGISPFERLGGALISAIRSFLLFGLVSMQLLLLPVEDLYKAVDKGSKTSGYCVWLDAYIYSWITYHVDFLEDRKVESVIDGIKDSAGL